MDNHLFFVHALVYLGSAVILVPIFKKIGLGAVLGYLTAGFFIGPWGIELIDEVESILHFAEFGVVLLLFLIGLELNPSRLWALRKAVFGTGLIQVLGTGALLTAIGIAFQLPFSAALIAGLGLSLSSTAFALQSLAEKNQLTQAHGRTAFSILLFQDLAVIPLLALIPILGVSPDDTPTTSGLLGILKVVGTLLGVVVAGTFFIRPALRFLASTKVHEIFTAAALLIVIGLSLLMEAIGLSMALGAFLGGVILANSEFRHELEADIEPFKGLLLGLFFIAVGMSADFGLISEKPEVILALTVALLLIKFCFLFLLGRSARLNSKSALLLAAVLPQGGEFAFVLFNIAYQFQVMEKGIVDLLIVVVTFSMALTPMILAAVDFWLKKKKDVSDREFDQIESDENKVIVAGFGRFGQISARILRLKGIGFTALEANPEQVDFVRRFGSKIYYGDASRIDLLRAAKADQAEIFILAIDDPAQSTKTAEVVKQNFPHLKIFARARNRQHALQLMNLGVDYVVRETLHSSLKMTQDLLQHLGLSYSSAQDTVKKFLEHDEKTLQGQKQYEQDEKGLIQFSKKAAQELEELFKEDGQEI